MVGRTFPLSRQLATDSRDHALRIGSGVRRNHPGKIFVTYLAGTVPPAPHSSWMPATANTAVRDWMFAQVNDAPYAG